MKFSPHKVFKNSWLIKAVSREMILSLVIVLLPIFFPKTVHAGLFSLFSDISPDQASAQTLSTASAPNSQTMGLLNAAVNTDPNPNKSTVDSPIISQNALLAEIGPSGPITDIDEPVNTQISTYVVRSGDNLSTIAKMFDVSVNTIIWANNLSGNTAIHEGQTLIILPISGIRYTVKKGDTIKGIVTKYTKNKDNFNDILSDVLTYNNITIDSTLTEGDVIIIPNVGDSAPTTVTIQKTGKKKYVPGSNPLHDADGPYYPGYYIRPIDHGQVSQGLHGYNAVDLAAPIGTPIHAAAAGTVIAIATNSAWNGGYGNYVIISHANGTQTLYAHASKVLVVVGEQVSQGQLIAKIGVTGETTGPHVHFEIRGAQNPFADPVQF